MREICVVTSSRADYGLLKPLIKRLKDEADVNLSVVVTGMHLCPEFGNTFREIEEDGNEIKRKIDIQVHSDSPSGMSKTMGMALVCFSEYFEANQFDLLIVLGDRYEIAAVCCAAVNQRIPIAHIHGGETTVGVIDEAYRHAITKMSAVHFTSCEVYRKRVIQLGEHPDSVFNVGALGVENVLNIQMLTCEQLEQSIDFPITDKIYGLVTFHPATLEDNAEAQLRELFSALDAFPNMQFIITKSNSDAGGRLINTLWDNYVINRDNSYLTESLGAIRYLSAMKHSAVVIGNSSSGVIEAPALQVPSVNIGYRQKGRVMAESVISCMPLTTAIEAAINKAITTEFRQQAAKTSNPYGNGEASKHIANILREQMKSKIDLKKRFYDVT